MELPERNKGRRARRPANHRRAAPDIHNRKIGKDLLKRYRLKDQLKREQKRKLKKKVKENVKKKVKKKVEKESIGAAS